MCNRRVRWAVFGLLLALGLAACDSGQGAEPQPPQIAYGHDLCEACSMLIDEPRFASATLLNDGSARKFDAIDDMIVYHMDRPNLMVRAWFVHDFATQQWVRAEAAFYVQSDQIRAPMGGGIAAFATRASAEEAGKRYNSKVMNWDEARAYVHTNVHGR